MKRKSFIVIVVILVLVIFGLCAFIIYDKDLLNIRGNTNYENNEEKKIEKIEEKQEILDVNSEQVNTLINQIVGETNNIYTSGTKYFGYYFQQNELNSEDMDDDIILYTALKKFLGDKSITSFYDNNLSISKDDIVPIIKSIFGNVKYDNKTIKITACDPGTFIYDNNTGLYTIESHGCGGAGTSLIKHKITGAIKKKNTIEITIAIVYVDCYSNGMTDNCHFGNSIDENQMVNKDDIILNVNKNIDNLEEEFDFNAYMDRLNKFKFTFTNDGNDNYVFTKVEKL